MRRFVPAVLFLSVAFVGCKAKELINTTKIEGELNKPGSTYKLMKDVAKDKYDPPKDGRLTDSQVQMYLKVRERERDIAKTAADQMEKNSHEADAAKNSIAGVMGSLKTLSSAADLATSDLRAARDLGINTQEYLWVKGQVMAVSMTSFAETSAKVVTMQTDKAYAEAKKAYDEAKDDQTKLMYKQMLDSYEQTRKEAKDVTENQDPALTYNRQLLKKYGSEMLYFDAAISKNGKKEGEAKSMDDVQKMMEKAVQDAKAKQ